MKEVIELFENDKDGLLRKYRRLGIFWAVFLVAFSFPFCYALYYLVFRDGLPNSTLVWAIVMAPMMYMNLKDCRFKYHLVKRLRG